MFSICVLFLCCFPSEFFFCFLARSVLSVKPCSAFLRGHTLHVFHLCFVPLLFSYVIFVVSLLALCWVWNCVPPFYVVTRFMFSIYDLFLCCFLSLLFFFVSLRVCLSARSLSSVKLCSALFTWSHSSCFPSMSCSSAVVLCFQWGTNWILKYVAEE
jgi:hypothetical protein